jgi:hypothetical protein
MQGCSFACGSVWVLFDLRHLGTEFVGKEDAEENIWTEGG